MFTCKLIVFYLIDINLSVLLIFQLSFTSFHCEQRIIREKILSNYMKSF